MTGIRLSVAVFLFFCCCGSFETFQGKKLGGNKEPTSLKSMDLNFKKQSRDLPGGTEKNPPAKAGDTGSIPGLGRFHMQLKPMCHNY